MSTDRDKGGRFRGGKSANPKGRPKGRKARLETLQDLDEVALKVANRKVSVKLPDGSTTSRTLYAQNMLNLSSTNPHVRLAAQAFIGAVRGAASDLARLKRIGQYRSTEEGPGDE